MRRLTVLQAECTHKSHNAPTPDVILLRRCNSRGHNSSPGPLVATWYHVAESGIYVLGPEEPHRATAATRPIDRFSFTHDYWLVQQWRRAKWLSRLRS